MDGRSARSDLLLLVGRGTQQDVEQDVRQQVDGDPVVVFDDETTTVEDLAGQLVSHLEHRGRVETRK